MTKHEYECRRNDKKTQATNQKFTRGSLNDHIISSGSRFNASIIQPAEGIRHSTCVICHFIYRLPMNHAHAHRHISKSHPRMAQLIRQSRRYDIAPAVSIRAFDALAESIAYQQLNGKAAATIWGRVRAHHGSGIAADDRAGLRHGGSPGGFVITIRGGPTIYHTGDTDLFSDMGLLSRFHKIDVMLVCIGDHFTMGPARAAEAVKLVAPGTAIPMHYATFPILTGTPEAFERELKNRQVSTQLREMKIGETISLSAS